MDLYFADEKTGNVALGEFAKVLVFRSQGQKRVKVLDGSREARAAAWDDGEVWLPSQGAGKVKRGR